MRPAYRLAAIIGSAGLGAVLWTALTGSGTPRFAMEVAASAPPIAVLLLVWGRMGMPAFPTRALVGGAIIGPVVALASHAVVAAFAAAFFLGFAESGRSLLDALRVDPRLTEVLGSPWVILLLVEVTAVAPLTEEVGKALGAGLGRPKDSREAFLAGAAAGVGFALVENLLYAGLGAAFGSPWPAIVVARAAGAAVHPLATGLVVLGWWEWRNDRKLVNLARRFGAGAAVHAIWNGTIVAFAVLETAFLAEGAPRPLAPVALSFSATLGVILAGVLYRLSGGIADGKDPFAAITFGEARAVGAWTVLAASLLVPVVVLVLAFPRFYLG